MEGEATILRRTLHQAWLEKGGAGKELVRKSILIDLISFVWA